MRTPDSYSGILDSIPEHPSVNHAVHPSGVYKLVAIQSTVVLYCQKIAKMEMRAVVRWPECGLCSLWRDYHMLVSCNCTSS